MSEVTRILSAIERGDPCAAEQLLPLVYDELRRMAAQKLAQEKPGQTLDATALVHEAYLRLAGPDGARHFNGRAHFFRAAADAMRRILVDRARERHSQKRGGAWRQVDLDQAAEVAGDPAEDVVAVSDALELLAQHDAVKAELVKLRFFAGLSTPQAAASLGISVATAERWWVFARTWLYAELSGAAGEKTPGQ
jgi:RNA polymerase sigma factor (TIGR02999 family)